jgi:glycosyltransferase involved in cell wall biosynthesis
VSKDRQISFVIIAYNEAANIARTIDSISKLDDLGRHEIIVVNDASTDSTGQIVEDVASRNPFVKAINLPRNSGRGYARSVGIAAAQGELIATVDADIVLPTHWLTCASAVLANHDAVGGVAVPDGDVQYIYKRFKLAPRTVNATTDVTGNNGLYRRQIFDAVRFDPSLREGEDSALNHAMKRRGLSCATIPHLVVQHYEDKDFGTSLRWLFDVGKGATRQLLVYRQVRQPDIVTAAFGGAIAISLLAAIRGHRFISAAAPVSFLVAASAQHVRGRFETPLSRWPAVASAIAVDSTMLLAYFSGRLVGVTALRKIRSSIPVRQDNVATLSEIKHA